MWRVSENLLPGDSYCFPDQNPISVFGILQASSPLQVKYADGELERLGTHNFGEPIAYNSASYLMFF